MKVKTSRDLHELRSGDLIVVNGAGTLGFLCWTDPTAIGYLGTDGEYHERTALPTYTVWVEHPMIGAKREIEARAASWDQQ